jgi:hypothetical protein
MYTQLRDKLAEGVTSPFRRRNSDSRGPKPLGAAGAVLGGTGRERLLESAITATDSHPQLALLLGSSAARCTVSPRLRDLIARADRKLD